MNADGRQTPGKTGTKSGYLAGGMGVIMMEINVG